MTQTPMIIGARIFFGTFRILIRIGMTRIPAMTHIRFPMYIDAVIPQTNSASCS